MKPLLSTNIDQRNFMHPTDFFVITLSGSTLLIFAWLHHRRHARVSSYHYIAVLDYETWKSNDRIQEEMELIHDGWLDSVEVCQSLINLESEGLIEHRIVPQVTPEGVRHIHQFKRASWGGSNEIWTPTPCPSLAHTV